VKITQLPAESTTCPWNNNGIIFGRFCPILYHTLYPYFLGLLFGAKFGSGNGEDVYVCCPAEKGIDTIVKKRPNDGSFGDSVPDGWRDVIYAEVIHNHGCERHGFGSRLVFPSCRKNKYVCPAGINNMFPFLNLPLPSCINLKKLRCPDWKENIYYSLED
jgi:hypothetical protein